MKKQSVKTFFNQPYPYYYEQRKLINLAGLVMILCFMIIYFLEPFIVYRPEHKVSYFWICIIHSLVPATVGYSFFSLVNFFGSDDKKWTTGKEISHLLILLLLAGAGNFLVRDIIYDNPQNWSARFFFLEVRNAFLIGSLLIAILVPVNYNRLFRKYQTSAGTISKSNHPEAGQSSAPSKPAIFIKTRVAEDDFHLQTDDFLMAKADGNYVELFLKSNGKVNKQLKRIPLKELESQLSDFPWIIRTHRSFLVNKYSIEKINGNAMGYQITLNGVSGEIPVSRGRIPFFNSVMKA